MYLAGSQPFSNWANMIIGKTDEQGGIRKKRNQGSDYTAVHFIGEKG